MKVVDPNGQMLANQQLASGCYYPGGSREILLPSPGTYHVGVYADYDARFDPDTACTVGPIWGSGSYGFTLTLRPARTFVGTSGGTTASAGRITDELFATRFDGAGDTIDVLDPTTLLPVRSIPAPEPRFGGSEGLASDGRDLYYLGVGHYPLLYRLDPADGTVLEKTLLWMGSGLYSDAAILQNVLYILDMGAYSIHLFDLTTQRYAASWPIGWWNGITLSGGLAAVEGPNRLYAADAFASGNVYELHPANGSLTAVIEPQSASEQRPVSLASDGSGRLLMADLTSDTVDVIARDGTWIGAVTLDAPAASLGGLATVEGLADMNGDGNVDLHDYELLQQCFDAAELPMCAGADRNGDGRVDLADTTALVNKFTGP